MLPRKHIANGKLDTLLVLAKEGLSNQEIASRVGINRWNVSRHILRFLGKDFRVRQYEEKISERFDASYVVSPNGCHEWTKSFDARGYGSFSYRDSTRKAHRFAWERKNGKIPKGLCVCHRCDNRKCVNLEHLFLGTTQENTEDARTKGRVPHGERHSNAKLSSSQVEEIRRLAAAGTRQRIIASRFGISGGHVSSIVNRQWRATG